MLLAYRSADTLVRIAGSSGEILARGMSGRRSGIRADRSVRPPSKRNHPEIAFDMTFRREGAVILCARVVISAQPGRSLSFSA